MATVIAGRWGYINGSTDLDFGTARSTGFGTSANPSSNIDNVTYFSRVSGRGSPSYTFRRTYAYFNVSSYTGIISNISLNIAGYIGGSTTAGIRVIPSTAAFGGDGSSDLITSEFFAGLQYGTPYNDSSYTWTTGANAITLNSTAATDIQNNNAFIVALVQDDADFTNSDPGVDVTESIGVAFGTNITLTFDETIPSNNSLTITSGKLTITSGKFTI